MNPQHLENFEPDLYEEFSNQEDDKISNIYSKYLNIIDDNENSTKSVTKVVFADEDDNEYEPIDRTVGDDSENICLLVEVFTQPFIQVHVSFLWVCQYAIVSFILYFTNSF